MKTSVFFGTPAFALPSLEAAISQTQVLAVVTQPDRPRGRGQQVIPCEVKQLAQQRGIEVFSPPSLRKPSDELSRFEAFVATTQPDLLLVTAYGNLLPQKYLDWPRVGPINVHASLLPKWRGAAPIQRSIEAGDAVSGVCLQRMVMALDAGDVLSEAQMALDPAFGAIALTQALAKLGGDLLEKYLAHLNGDELSGRPQDPSLVTLAPKITKTEGLWRPTWTASQTLNRVRAFEAWPKVQLALPDQTPLKIMRCAASRESAGPGHLFVHDREVVLGCADGAVAIERVQAPNRGPVDALSYFQRPSPTRQAPLLILDPS